MALERTTPIERSDRHVLAAAVASDDMTAIVTTNVRHFPAAACDAFGIDVIHPDAFLYTMHERAPAQVQDALINQAADLSRPPITVEDVVDRLDQIVPVFVRRVRVASR